MEQRVRQLETDVAVLGQRMDTLEGEVAMIREELKAVRTDIAKAQGLIIAVVCIVQSIGIFMGA
jgi:outer membrane murein-binding lipoprotein Lpp|tara:strand:- start:965 stop:1156 length:192 start_codon:yes stop_codon:yes gene_type:complete